MEIRPEAMIRRPGSMPVMLRRPSQTTSSAADPSNSSASSAGTPARGNLHAKTGTTNTVAALGGFVTAKNGEVLAFSLIYNGNDRGSAKAAMDQIGANMADFVRE